MKVHSQDICRKLLVILAVCSFFQAVVHPLGMGLDENAVATVSTWRFAPATKDGQPVAVAVYEFHER
jgi:Gram-negative bacterial TonB protein C-terminal